MVHINNATLEELNSTQATLIKMNLTLSKYANPHLFLMYLELSKLNIFTQNLKLFL